MDGSNNGKKDKKKGKKGDKEKAEQTGGAFSNFLQKFSFRPKSSVGTEQKQEQTPISTIVPQQQQTTNIRSSSHDRKLDWIRGGQPPTNQPTHFDHPRAAAAEAGNAVSNFFDLFSHAPRGDTLSEAFVGSFTHMNTPRRAEVSTPSVRRPALEQTVTPVHSVDEVERYEKESPEEKKQRQELEEKRKIAKDAEEEKKRLSDFQYRHRMIKRPITDDAAVRQLASLLETPAQIAARKRRNMARSAVEEGTPTGENDRRGGGVIGAVESKRAEGHLSLKEKLERALQSSVSGFQQRVSEERIPTIEEQTPTSESAAQIAARLRSKMARSTREEPTPTDDLNYRKRILARGSNQGQRERRPTIAEAQAFYAQHRLATETPQQTFHRLSLMEGGMAWHNQIYLAAETLRQSASARSGVVTVEESADDRNKRQNRERQQRYRDKKRNEEAAAIAEADAAEKRERRLALDKIYQAEKRLQETPAERENRLAAVAASMSQHRELETPAERERRLAAVAASMSQHRELETPAERERRLAAVAASMSQHRELETPAERERRLAAVAASMSERRELETPAERDNRLATVAASMSERRQQESALEYERRLRVDAAQHRVARARAANARRNAVQQMVERANYEEDAVISHNCGYMDTICQFCGSHNFASEKPSDNKFTVCCNKGKMIPKNPVGGDGGELKYPKFLESLLTSPWDADSRNFRENIRSYNSALSFASFGAKLENVPGRGPYVFKVHGQVYHFASHTEPRTENERSYAQLYVLDSSTQAVNTRMQHRANVHLRPAIVRRIHDFFRQNNSFARSYEMMREVEERERNHALANNLDIPIVRLSLNTERQQDERRYNLPTSNEVAMVFVNEGDEPPFHRDIRIYPRNPTDPSRPLIRLNIRDCNLDPMVYSIMFPYGQPGWHPKYLCNGVHATMRQYKRSLTAIRDEFSPIMRAGKLSQQWVVDSYLQVEAHNLDYVRFNQDKLRADLYKGLADYVNTKAAEAGKTAGTPVILPSTFEGSPRNMRQRLQDAMAIFGKFGAVDMFVTFTSNPNWPEVQENLKPGETAADRFDLVCRVFNLKLKELMADLTVHHALGKCIAWVYTIEFQKRGLPHAHILLVVEEGDKFKTAARIDEIVCAEIPDENTHPTLHSIVTSNMIHTCGARCLEEDGSCGKSFPREFQDSTVVNQQGTGYPLYRRRIGATFVKNNHTYDNRHIVPYNKYLLLKYNAHINVEICTSLKAVKYIYKYIYKGFDCSNCTVAHIDGEEVVIHDELTNYVNGRYVSAPEAYWRLVSFKMHDRSHPVVQLPVHLPREQLIYFEEGREEEALLAAQTGQTKLTAWFKLNAEYAPARKYLYTEIPDNFVFANNKWKTRERGNVIGRMYTVPASDKERFALRLLLLNVRGATSYENLRTYNGVEYGTFEEAAIQRKLLSSDKEFEKLMAEAGMFDMPYQLRQTFAIICVFCKPKNARALFDKYTNEKSDMILDFIRQNYNKEAAINKALHEIESVFKVHNTDCNFFNLPTPTGTHNEALSYDETVEADNAERLIATLNPQQRVAFDKIVDGIDNPSSQKLFYLNGPGGSGKTYLYETLISFVRGRGQRVNAYAFSGIASTLLSDATTIHSGFGISIKLDETTVSYIKADSVVGKNLKNASLLILDEITMLNQNGLRVIDKLLREEIMKNNLPFGGKTLVISGDFRQTLPIVVRGKRAAILEASITSNENLWRKFQNLSLSSNMRSAGQNAHKKWLLDIGSGDTPQIDGLSQNAVEIPAAMVTTGDVIEETFGNDIRSLSEDELSRRVVLASTNAVTLEINAKIIEQLDGELVTYTSADSIISEGDTGVERLYPVEFLNSQTGSGLPQHKLSLKVGAVVMLILNLNKKKGLCNGTRLIVRGLHEHFIRCQIISKNHRGDSVFIARIDITPSDTTLPFKMKRRQFPLIPAFAITINKSQGQTYDIVGVHLDQPVFGHGQLYVALSRCKDPTKIKIFIKEGLRQGQLLNDGRYFTENIVYKEIFRLTVR